MESRNSCYTYFRIVGEFNPDHVTELLGLQPEKSWRKGATRLDGTTYDFSLWATERCSDYDVIIENQLKKTIAPLLNKIDLLNKIRLENEVEFYIEIVPTIYAGEQNPSLNPSLEVIDFCHATRTQLDIDMYVMDSEDE